jgi:hypothetical protein
VAIERDGRTYSEDAHSDGVFCNKPNRSNLSALSRQRHPVVRDVSARLKEIRYQLHKSLKVGSDARYLILPADRVDSPAPISLEASAV